SLFAGGVSSGVVSSADGSTRGRRGGSGGGHKRCVVGGSWGGGFGHSSCFGAVCADAFAPSNQIGAPTKIRTHAAVFRARTDRPTPIRAIIQQRTPASALAAARLRARF